MTSTVVLELPVRLISIDLDRFPRNDGDALFDDMLYYCSKFEPLPAIHVRVEPSSIVLTRGHIYLAIAERLQRSRARAILDRESDPAAVDALVSSSEVDVIDWESEERAVATAPGRLHRFVFRFERELSLYEKGKFTQDLGATVDSIWASTPIRPFVGSPVLKVEFEGQANGGEIAAWMPTGEQWFAKWMDAIRRFSVRVCPIVAFQGSRFIES